MESNLPQSSQLSGGYPTKTMLIEAVKGHVPKFVWRTRALGITSELPFLMVYREEYRGHEALRL